MAISIAWSCNAEYGFSRDPLIGGKVMSFLIEPVMGENAAPSQGGDPISLVLMMIVFAAVFYFLIWRPQNKRAKEHKNLMSGLSKGDEITTSGGLIGRVVKVGDDFVTLTLTDGVDIHCQKVAVTAVLPKGTIKNI